MTTPTNESILSSTKKILGISESYTEFDLAIMTHINTVFDTLSDLGVGPEDGFMIESVDDKWADFTGDYKKINTIKSYIYLRVRTLFDPPSTSYHLSAIEEQIKEMEFRISTAREGESWTPPIAERTLYPLY